MDRDPVLVQVDGIDLRSTLRTIAFLPGDPTVRLTSASFERATVTPEGTGTVRVEWGDDEVARVTTHGDAAAWLRRAGAGSARPARRPDRVRPAPPGGARALATPRRRPDPAHRDAVARPRLVHRPTAGHQRGRRHPVAPTGGRARRAGSRQRRAPGAATPRDHRPVQLPRPASLRHRATAQRAPDRSRRASPSDSVGVARIGPKRWQLRWRRCRASGRGPGAAWPCRRGVSRTRSSWATTGSPRWCRGCSPGSSVPTTPGWRSCSSRSDRTDIGWSAWRGRAGRHRRAAITAAGATTSVTAESDLPARRTAEGAPGRGAPSPQSRPSSEEGATARVHGQLKSTVPRMRSAPVKVRLGGSRTSEASSDPTGLVPENRPDVMFHRSS